MYEMNEPLVTDTSADEQYLNHKEMLAAIDALSALDRARLDLLERRHLDGTDFAVGDLLQQAICSALFREKNCPRGRSFLAFLAQSMRNIAGRQRKHLRRQVPIGVGAAHQEGVEESEVTDDAPGALDEIIRSEDEKRAAEVLAILQRHYESDEHAQLVLLGWDERMRGKQLREFVGVSQAELDYIIKRIRRCAARLFPNGWRL